MFDFVRAISGRKKIQRANIEEAMHKYSVDYCVALQKLYDMGFTSSPFSIDEIDFRIAVQQEYPDELRLLRSPLTGRTLFDENTLLYAMWVTENEEFSKVAEQYRKVLISRKNLYKCDSLLKEVPFRVKGSATISVKVVFSEGIDDRTKYQVIPEALLQDDNKYVWGYSLGDALVTTVCNELGITEYEINKYRRENKPFFLKGVTGQQEEELIDTIMRGYIPLEGDYGEKLCKVMVNYYSTYFSENSLTSTVQLPFESYIYNKAVDNYCKAISKIRDNMRSLGLSELYITPDRIYFQGTRPQVSNYKPYYRDLNVGMYCNLDTIDIFEGIQGVFYDYGEGVPIYLTDFGVVYSYPCDSFKEQDKEKMYKRKFVEDDDGMRFYIERMVHNPLTSELVFALFLARCGQTEYRLVGNYSTENVDAFENCSEEAIHIAKDKLMLLEK